MNESRIGRRMAHYRFVFSSFARVRFFFQRNRMGYGQRRFYTGIARKFAAKKINAFPGEERYRFRDTEDVLIELNNDGKSHLPSFLSSEEIKEIKECLEGLSVFDYLSEKSGQTHDLSHARANLRSGMYRRSDLAIKDPIMKIANDPRLLEIAQAYLGVKPVLSNVLVWWSFPNNSNAVGPQNFHRDVDDFKFLKLFVYLTDVDEQSGPHIFVKGSHKDERNELRELRRYSDDEIANAYPESSIETIVGPAGEAFFSDSFSFHKGLPAVSRERLLLQFQWSIFPIGIEEYEPRNHVSSFEYDQQVNRLLLRSSD